MGSGPGAVCYLPGVTASPPGTLHADAAAATGDDRTTRLKQRFGLADFRPWQREAIDALLDGPGRALVVAPTGGGKSLCYQYPATELDGTSVVISPLIALMEDQVRSLTARGIPATFLASTLDLDERRRRERALQDSHYRLVYVAPERLAAGGFLESLRRLHPPLVAVDEAHCIAEWGHDFRPDYLRIGDVLRTLEPRHVLACTATATPRVRDEILRGLGLPPAETAVLVRGFARPNLHLATELVEQGATRATLAVRAVREALGLPPRPSRGGGAPATATGGAIVYAMTRRRAEQMADKLGQAGLAAAAYHAGLPPEERARVGDAFAAGALDAVAATNAFGMGIDRPDIRAVVHVQAPASIESYYQEVGRAGRDGQPAHGLLLTGTSDLAVRRRLVERSGRDGEVVAPERVAHHWALFLDLMRYAEAGSCRHDFILRYFGDERETLGGCGHCDVCVRLGDAAGEGHQVPTELPAEDALVIRKALAGVARNRGRSGLQAVAEMLRGDETERVRRLGHDQLTTYGLLRDRSKAWVVALLRRLVTAGYADLTADEYPVIVPTTRGVEVMKGDVPPRVLLPEEPVSPGRKRSHLAGRRTDPDDDVPLEPEGQALFDALRAARKTAADAQGVPAYVICHDRTLREIARRRPRDEAELAEVRGMGPARIESHGDRFLAVVREHGAGSGTL